MKKTIIFLTTLGLLFGAFKFFLLRDPDKITLDKLSLIEDKIASEGYHARWFVISGHRDEWYNSILPNSAKKSFHIKDKAIDIYVIDIDGDWDFDSSDIEIIYKVTKSIEGDNPKSSGGFGTYTNRGYFSRHMIHFDTRGNHVRYDM